MEQKLIQIGLWAEREPNGEFGEAMPIYTVSTPKLEARKASIMSDIEKIQARYFKAYIDKMDLAKKQRGESDE